MAFQIIKTAKYLPKKILTNNDLSEIMETSDKWIYSRTGIHQRHISENENTSDLATKVAINLLNQEGLAAKDLKFIIVATMTPDYLTPSTAAIVQGNIGAEKAFCFDISAACSGFEYALSVAKNYLNENDYGIVIGSEVVSKVLDWSDRSTSVLFGDGAAGALVKGVSLENDSLIAEKLITYGDLNNHLVSGFSDVKQHNFDNKDENVFNSSFFKMNGREIYNFATRNVTKHIKEIVTEANIEFSDIDYFVLHQANNRLIKKIASKLDISEEKFPTNVEFYGNTSAASVPILLDELIKNKKIKKGNTILICGFGGGLTIGAQILKM